MLFSQQMIRAKVSQRVTKTTLFVPSGDVRFTPESEHSLRQCVRALSSRGAGFAIRCLELAAAAPNDKVRNTLLTIAQISEAEDDAADGRA
jgi:hypothetical protein